MKVKPNFSKFRIYAVLSNHDFFLIWLGEIFSRIGDGFYFIALVWLIMEMTGSGIAIGVIMATYTAGGLIFGLIGGALADRWNRKRLMILSGILSALFASLIPVFHGGRILNLPLLAGLVFLLSAVTQLFEPALDSSIPNIVHESQLMTANALDRSTRELGQILGPALGGVLIAIIGITNVFYIDAASFLIISATITLARVPQKLLPIEEKLTVGKLFADIWEGWCFIKGQVIILSVILIAFVANMALAPLTIVTALFVKEILRGGPQVFGFLMSGLGAGALVGMLLLGALGERFRKGRTILFGFVLMGLAMGLVGITFHIYQTSFCFILLGTGMALINVPYLTILQSLTPDHLRGKVLSTDRTLSMASIPISQAGAGFLVEWMGPRLLFGILGVILLSCAIVAACIRELREIR